jgi:hypothetical protein
VIDRRASAGRGAFLVTEGQPVLPRCSWGATVGSCMCVRSVLGVYGIWVIVGKCVLLFLLSLDMPVQFLEWDVCDYEDHFALFCPSPGGPFGWHRESGHLLFLPARVCNSSAFM